MSEISDFLWMMVDIVVPIVIIVVVVLIAVIIVGRIWLESKF